jgi:uncharacterized protein YuzE
MASLESDGDVNAMYVTLRKGRVSSTEPLAENVMVDLDEKHRVLGLELLLPPTLKKEIKAHLSSESRRQSKHRSRTSDYPMFR